MVQFCGTILCNSWTLIHGFATVICFLPKIVSFTSLDGRRFWGRTNVLCIFKMVLKAIFRWDSWLSRHRHSTSCDREWVFRRSDVKSVRNMQKVYEQKAREAYTVRHDDDDWWWLMMADDDWWWLMMVFLIFQAPFQIFSNRSLINSK